MESALARATAAAGVAFSGTVMTDLQGQSMMSDLRGKVVVVDFFARGWKNWKTTAMR